MWEVFRHKQTAAVADGEIEQQKRETGYPASLFGTGQFLAADDVGNNPHDFVMAAAAPGGAGGQLLDLVKLLFHIRETGVLMQSPVNISQRHMLAFADNLIRCVFHGFSSLNELNRQAVRPAKCRPAGLHISFCP